MLIRVAYKKYESLSLFFLYRSTEFTLGDIKQGDFHQHLQHWLEVFVFEEFFELAL